MLFGTAAVVLILLFLYSLYIYRRGLVEGNETTDTPAATTAAATTAAATTAAATTAAATTAAATTAAATTAAATGSPTTRAPTTYPATSLEELIKLQNMIRGIQDSNPAATMKPSASTGPVSSLGAAFNDGDDGPMAYNAATYFHLPLK